MILDITDVTMPLDLDLAAPSPSMRVDLAMEASFDVWMTAYLVCPPVPIQVPVPQVVVLAETLERTDEVIKSEPLDSSIAVGTVLNFGDGYRYEVLTNVHPGTTEIPVAPIDSSSSVRVGS